MINITSSVTIHMTHFPRSTYLFLLLPKLQLQPTLSHFHVIPIIRIA